MLMGRELGRHWTGWDKTLRIFHLHAWNKFPKHVVLTKFGLFSQLNQDFSQQAAQLFCACFRQHLLEHKEANICQTTQWKEKHFHNFLMSFWALGPRHKNSVPQSLCPRGWITSWSSRTTSPPLSPSKSPRRRLSCSWNVYHNLICYFHLSYSI